MATQAQINANRKNAKKSTGPRTARGKEVVSQNVVKHGLCAKKNVIRTESQEEFDLFQDEMIADLSPAGGMELMLAKRIVSLAWRLRRTEYFQNAVLDALIEQDLLGYLTGWDNSLIRKARDNMEAGDADLILGIAVNRDFAKARTLDLLLLYERRIESSLFKITAEFRKTQRLRKEKQTQFAGFQPEMLNRAADVDMKGPASPEECLSGRNLMKPEAATSPASLPATPGQVKPISGSGAAAVCWASI